jgi:NAD(P)-dependent dehydrogenase (short-subunit alcohol dehydrogenase family)
MPATPQVSSERRVALVTGAAQGIGAAIASRLAADGVNLALADLGPRERTAEVATSLAEAHGITAQAYHVDIRDSASCQRLVKDVVADFDGLDILVNNAGVNARGNTVEMPESTWLDVVDTNLNGTYRMSVAAYPALRERQGAVVNLASTAGLIAVKGSAAYAVSKAAIIHMTRVFALEWAQDKVRVNAVGPTIVPTAMTADVRDNPDYMREKLASIPMGQMVQASDVAEAVVWLASPAARLVTGQTLFVDGGATII